MADAQRRLQGDFFDALVGGKISATEAARGLAKFGFSRDQVMVVALEGTEPGLDPDTLAQAATDHCSRVGGGFLVSAGDEHITMLMGADPAPALDELIEALIGRLGVPVRAGAGSAVAPAEVSRSVREAKYALQVCRLEGWSQAGFDDLGTYRLLLSMADPDALRAFADALLSQLDAYDREHGGELLTSLEAFLQHNARWETAAAQLFVHRHTLRYRMRKVEQLTGRDLSSSFDRMEFWLALRARDLLAAQSES